ncbi:MAG: type II secretion system GspH family protein [Psychrosphaera sp.]|nr:type II secretion system GspH family protein [Psychrosphaera sp.]
MPKPNKEPNEGSNRRLKISPQKRFKNSGFTLLEVLISTIILFLFITMASQAFSQAAQSSLKAERAVKVASLVPLLMENIRGKILAVDTLGDVGGQGQMLDMQYQWQAKILQRKAPASRFDPSTMDFKDYKKRFNLWSVEVVITLGKYQRSWQYEEISWFK